MIGSKMPNGEMVPLNIPVSDCYYTGTMMNGSGLVAISQCNNDTVKCYHKSDYRQRSTYVITRAYYREIESLFLYIGISK